jgi:hypothetical protein
MVSKELGKSNWIREQRRWQMNRLNWIVREIYKDGRKNFKWVLKGAGLVLALILLIKVFIYFDIKDLFLPIVGILFPIGMLYHWYSMSYDDEQKKIVKKLKGDD